MPPLVVCNCTSAIDTIVGLIIIIIVAMELFLDLHGGHQMLDMDCPPPNHPNDPNLSFELTNACQE